MKIEPRSSFQNINEVQGEASTPVVKKEPIIGQNATDRFEATKTSEQTLSSQSALPQPKGNEDGLFEQQMLKARLGESTKKMKGTEAETIKAPTTGLTSERFETVAEARRLLQEAARQRGLEIPPELQSIIDRLNPFDDAENASGIPGLFESPISFETIKQLKEALEKFGQTSMDASRTIDLGNTGETSENYSSLASKILEAIRKLRSDDEDEPSKTAKSTVGS